MKLYNIIVGFDLLHCSDPYKVHHPDDDVARPPTVKQDELKQLDVGEEDEGGWAGHHEEVDYTKEVVFSDSSDEETEGQERNKEGGGKKNREHSKGRQKVCKQEQMFIVM